MDNFFLYMKMDTLTYSPITSVHVYSRRHAADIRFVNQEVRVGTNDPGLTGSDPSDNPICDTMPLDTPCIDAIYVFHCGSPGPIYGRYVSISLAASTLDDSYPNILVLSEVHVFIDPSAPTPEDPCPNLGNHWLHIIRLNWNIKPSCSSMVNLNISIFILNKRICIMIICHSRYSLHIISCQAFSIGYVPVLMPKNLEYSPFFGYDNSWGQSQSGITHPPEQPCCLYALIVLKQRLPLPRK